MMGQKKAYNVMQPCIATAYIYTTGASHGEMGFVAEVRSLRVFLV